MKELPQDPYGSFSAYNNTIKKGYQRMDTIKIQHGNTKIIAHRGLSGIECENTCAAFVAAGNRDYFGIETDVHKTADGKYIIIHDDETGRVAAENQNVEKTAFDQLRSIQLLDKDGVPRGDLCLPALSEYLRICKKYKKTAVLELKNPFLKQEVQAIVQIVKETYDMHQLIFISFDYQTLVFLRELEPDAAIQFLCFCEINDELIQKLKKYNFDLDIYFERLNTDAIELLHSRGIKINCWTVDDQTAAERLAAAGVDYITTNILQ